MNGALNQQVCVSKFESPAKKIRVEEYNDFGALASMRQEWDDFMESVGAEIFLTYDWCRIWWKYYGENRVLKIFVFRCQNRLVGIIPLFFEKIWIGPILIRAAKIVGSDFTLVQFSLPIHNKHIKGVIQKFFELLSSGYNWDIIHIGPIAGLYNHYDELRETLVESFGRSYCVLAEQKGVQTYFQLADDWEKQLASLKKGTRWDIRRSYRALGPGTNCPDSIFASTDNFEQIFENFVSMHQSYWRSLDKLGHFGDWPDAMQFHREVAIAQLKKSRLRLLEVRSGKYCLGYEYVYRFGNRYFEFLNARTSLKELAKISVGRVVFSEQVKKALDEGVRCIDSMRGKYEYKLRLGGKLLPTRNLYVVPKRWATVVRVRLFRLFAYLLNLFYYRIWYGRVAPKLPHRRKGLWKIWIRTSGFC